jgi:sulfate adenylyltransferase
MSSPEAHGGQLVNVLRADQKAQLLEEANHIPNITLNQRHLCDIELILNGGFSPLKGFMNKKQYESVVESMRLDTGVLWPMPIMLDIKEADATLLKSSGRVGLRTPEGVLLAVMTVKDIWQPDRMREAQMVFGSTDSMHPGVKYLLEKTQDYYVGGELEGLELPTNYDFANIRLTPRQLRDKFDSEGFKRVVAFQTRNPMHRAHQELTLRAAKQTNAHVLIHPVVGMTKPGDVDHFTRVKCYKKLLERYLTGSATLSLLPLAMRMGGPREALWHAIIRKNYGATHFIVGRDHAGPGKDSKGKLFYEPYEARDLVVKHAAELKIEAVPFDMLVYVPETNSYHTENEIKPGTKTANISGTELRDMLSRGDRIPEWFTFPEIADILGQAHPARLKQGVTLFFSGLSGSGKSTVANIVHAKLMELDFRPITILDGDIVRTNLSSELGFTKEHRSLNIKRIGFVANEITKNGGMAICCPIAPYEADRKANRELISQHGNYIEIFVATPIEECEKRDRKGLYAKARQGLVKGFTGIDDPYEAPTNAEIVLNTTKNSALACADQVLAYLREKGLILP